MATYYVRLGGIGNGTGPAISQAWGTIAQALAASGGMSSGDTVYIAPGNYNEQLTVNFTSPTAATYIIGDPTASQFTGMAAGYVRITAYPSNQASANNFSGAVFSATSKNYLNISEIHFEGSSSTTLVDIATCRYVTISNCSFVNHDSTTSRCLNISAPANSTTPIDSTISKCVFMAGKNTGSICVRVSASPSAATSLNLVFNDCLLVSSGYGYNITAGLSDNLGGISYYNNTIIAGLAGIYNTNGGGNSTYPHVVKNCLIYSPTGVNNQAGVTSYYQITYSRLLVGSNVAVSLGTGTSTTGALGLETGYALINGIQTSPMFASVASSPNQNYGNATSAPTTDIYNVAWSGASPDAGVATYNNVTGITAYNPTDRNASTITIAPGSTSQSIELYLGATGLTASTSGLSARYNRTRSASVSIPLVARTIDQGAPASAGVWIAGGFAEVDATNMPGVYRLDLPDAALAAGADDVTVVVRGASGTNGAVRTVKLSIGGLTSAETASAVWGASPGPYNDATTMGGIVNQIDTLANGIDTNVTQTPILVWDELTSSHTTAGSMGERMQPNKLADEILARDIGSGSSAGSINERTVRSALRGLRNKTTVINNEMTVYKEDDTSTAWSATVSSSDSSKTITGVDPS